MNHASLLEHLSGDGHSLKLPQLIDIEAQVADGMVYLVLSITARNVLVGENLICKKQILVLSMKISMRNTLK